MGLQLDDLATLGLADGRIRKQLVDLHKFIEQFTSLRSECDTTLCAAEQGLLPTGVRVKGARLLAFRIHASSSGRVRCDSGQFIQIVSSTH
ncbi:hypothetical protein [Gordonia sp. SND2]|uniref:hypothetical protein n=1 Tax=Gordonia sp. SND2 TaxID=3388659 RepID=UPI00398B4CC2